MSDESVVRECKFNKGDFVVCIDERCHFIMTMYYPPKGTTIVNDVLKPKFSDAECFRVRVDGCLQYWDEKRYRLATAEEVEEFNKVKG